MEKAERLTIRNSDGTASQPTHSSFFKVFNRLAEYEDTGLFPEEIEQMKKDLASAKETLDFVNEKMKKIEENNDLLIRKLGEINGMLVVLTGGRK